MLTKICIPIGIQVVIDDVGWWSGKDESKLGKPFRTGIQRDHVPDDYRAIAELGKRLGMRPQAAMILCEWDRTNILKELPKSTWMGSQWNNARWVGSWLDEAADIINSNCEHMELTLHGIGHEYWESGNMTRAEWYDQEGHMRPVQEVILHLEYYKKLLEQNGFSQYPESFVPAAFRYRFNRHDQDIAYILKDFGIKYVSTPYYSIFKATPLQGKYFGVEHGIITVDRSRDLCRWYEIGPEPSGEISGPICGMHWPNILSEEPQQNSEAVIKWVKLLKKESCKFDRMLARNTEEAFSQIIYHEKTIMSKDLSENIIKFDFSEVDKLEAKGLLKYFYVKIDEGVLLHSSDSLHVYNEMQAYDGSLDKKKYKLYKVVRKLDSVNGSIGFSIVKDVL